MNYIEKIKKSLAEKINVENDLLDLYTLIVFLKGKNATLEDIHNAWAIWRNNTKPDHKSLIPFDELSPEIKEMDREYTNAIIETANNLYQREV